MSNEVKKATPQRTLAIVFWVLAFVCEVLAVLAWYQKVDLGFSDHVVQMVIFLVVDLIFTILGSLFWKKANKIAPVAAKEKSFWIVNHMGQIAASFVFVPFILIIFPSRNGDSKAKSLSLCAAFLALVLCIVAVFIF